MKKVLILGANGFIGKKLTEHLLSRHSDLELTLFSRKFTGIHEKFQTENPKVKFIKGDFKELLSLVPIINNQDIVFHLISSSFPSSSWNNPDLDIETNLLPSIRLFKLCGDLNVKKIVFLSSGGTIYGKQTGLLDEDSTTRPFSPYGIIKLAIENFLEYSRIKNGLNYDIYRVTNPYGPYQEKFGFGVINTWLRQVQSGIPLRIFGDGTASKDYIYIQDVAEIISHSIVSDLNTSGTYNLSSGFVLSLNELIEILKKVCEKPFETEYISAPKSDNQIVQLDNSKLMNYLGDYTLTNPEEGIKKTWEYIKKKHKL